MKANETTLRNLLQGERQYVVPLYQRPYSWERKDLRQLWNDLLDVVETDGESSHFLGSVVLAPSPANTPASVQVWLVVDGQQRLTTLSILLCAIRDHVRAENDTLAAKIDDLYLFNKYASGAERYTLLPTQADRQSWISLLERAPDAGGEDRIGEAYRFFRKELVMVDDPEDPHDTSRIEQAIAGRLSIVEIAAHRDDNVHRIFESLNYTGQPLTQADLLRNYLFMRLPTRGEHIYDRHWLPLQDLLTNKQLEELVWLDLVLGGDDRATQDAVYQSQQSVLSGLSDEDAIERWIDELHRKARQFKRILEPGREPDPSVRKALDRLARWGTQVVYPIALHVLVARDEGRLDAHEAARALRVVESYLVRRMLVGIASTGANRVLMSLIKDLGEAVPSAEAVTEALSGPRKRFPTDGQLREAVLSNNFYWSGRGPQRTYVLRCLEEDFESSELLDFSSAKLSIEHVLPQSPTDSWLDMLASAPETEQESPIDLHRRLVHTLGNLTLTAHNAKLSNDGFDQKKRILADSGLRMNRHIAEQASWTAKEIRERGRALGERAVRIWPGPADDTVVEPPNPRWSLMTQVLASIPAGRWTGFADVSEVVGNLTSAVRLHLRNTPMANCHRVLNADGGVPSGFRWPDPARTDDPAEVLRQEGVTMSDERAAPHLRMTPAELAWLIGLDTDIPEVTELGDD